MAAQAGSAYIPVRPDFSGFHEAIAAKFKSADPDALKAGQSMGQNLAKGIKAGLGDPLSAPLEESSRKQQSKAPAQGDQIAGAFARGFQDRLKAAFASLPKAKIDADSSQADRRIVELRASMEELSKKTIGIDIDAAEATARLTAIKAELKDIGRNATVDVRADTTAASAELAKVDAQVRELDGKTARINVEAGGGGLAALGLLSGGLGALPLGAAALGGAGVLGGSLLSAGAGFGGLASVAVPAINAIKTALQAQTQAQNQAGQSATQAQSRELALAGAQQQLAAAVRNEAYVHQQALQAVQSAEQQLAQAQVSEGDAQRALTQARIDAQQHIEDLKNSLIDAGLAIQQDEINVQKAKLALDALNASTVNAVALQQAQAQLAQAMQAQKAVDSDPQASQAAKDVAAAQVQAAEAALKNAQTQKKASDLQRKEAELAYQEAIQHLKEEQLQQQRLAQETKKASQAGVDGSDQVIKARERLHQADVQVANAEQALANARANVARQDQQAADQVASARRAVTSATLQGQQANTKLADSVAKLTPAEKALMEQWKSFTGVYKDWAKSLEPAVLPVLADGISLVGSQLGRTTPLVIGSASAMRTLEADAKSALAGPFWTSFITDVSDTAPKAILGLGSIAGHVFEGIAGVIRAFLPYTQQLLTGIDGVAKRFDQWGQSLAGSSGFSSFMSTVQHDAPVVARDLGDIGGAFIQITKAVYPLGQLEIQVIGPLAQGIGELAKSYPGLVQVGVALFALAKVNSALQITPLVKGFLATGAAEDIAATGAAGFGVKLRALGATMIGVEAETATTKEALLGLGVAAGVAVAAFALPTVIQKWHDSISGTIQPVNDLSAALTKLGQTGDWGDALGKQFQVGGYDALQGAKSVDVFTGSVRSIVDPSFMDYVTHAGQQLFSWVPGVTTNLQEAHNKLGAVDDALTNMVKSGQALQAAAAFQKLSDQLKAAGFNTNQIDKVLPNYTSLIGGATAKNNLFTQSVMAQNLQMSQSAHAFQDEQNEIISFQQGITTATGLVNTNGRVFFGNTQQALANRQMLIQLAATVQNYADQLVNNNQLTDKNIGLLKNQRDQLITVAEKFGLSHDQAQAYVDQLLKIPPKINTKVNVDAQGALSIASSSGLNSLLQGLLGPGNKFGNTTNLVTGNAAGGYIQGSGGPRADNLITPISAGEFVVNAPATSRYLPFLAAINDEGNRGTPYRGRGYAGGGLVRPRGHDGAVALPGFAGGGLVTGPKYERDYHYVGEDTPKPYSLAGRAVDDIFAGMIAYSIGRTAAAMAGIVGALVSSGTGDGAKAVAFAEAQLGKPYVWGATGPDSFDCSGLTMRAWQAAGKEIGRTTYEQINAGRGGTRDQALPGDLHLPETGHVMMFVHPRSGGSNEMIHAPHTGTVVQYAPYRGGGWVRLIATPGGAAGAGGSSQSAQAAQAFAQAHLGEFGWGIDQMTPLIQLWNQESNWRWDATNPSSGAYGIPQSLPADKMASAGADWRTNAYTQVRWGLGYIHDRYGSPSAAEAHELSAGWYDDGGWLQPGLNLALNASGKPEPILTAQQWDALISGVSGGGSRTTEYHAHFDGASSAALQTHVRTAFHTMGIEQAMHERVGRRG